MASERRAHEIEMNQERCHRREQELEMNEHRNTTVMKWKYGDDYETEEEKA